MNKSTKGAIAAAAAGVLMLGGAGSLAFWTDSATVSGASITSGELKLTNASCGAGWTLDGGTAYTSQRLVPGDELTKVCTYTVSAKGSHITASFKATPVNFTGSQALRDEITVTGSYAVGAGAPTNGQTAVPVVDGDTVTATVKVTWPYGVQDNDSNAAGGLTAVLDAITVTATQGHN